ncbi:MAG: extracellular solute-binding protein [Anaerolineae bacterium]|jgi:multiple sugar transport system substrate-binding protein|nr:extracellular solute-binding protein [Anaerolineae bacterium]
MSQIRYKLLVLFFIFALALAACGGGSAEEATTDTESDASTDTTTTESEPEEEAEAPAEEEAASTGDRVQIRWFVGLGTGTDAQQVAVQEEVVADFNSSQDAIELVLEIVPNEAAVDALATQIASGNGPDIVGPVGWTGSNAFQGQWLDIGPYIESSGFDTSIFDPALVDSYQTEDGQVGLPFAVFPAAVYYVPAMFDELDLAYPPSNYGDMYELDGEMVEWNWDTFTEVARRMTIDINGNNSLDEGFDRTQIVQVGYSPQWQTHVNYMASYRAGAVRFVAGEEGNYSLEYPAEWKEAIEWFYDGIWGEQPFIANGALSGSPEFGNGNLFNSGRAAMAITPLWYTCCLGEFRDAGLEFQAGILPVGDDGQYHGRVDADTFRIWKGTDTPEEAFTVLTYLITDGADKLLPVYGAMPAIAEKQEPFFAAKSADYPFVLPETWEVFKAGLTYPDSPSAEQYQPNHTESWTRQQAFFDLLQNTSPEELDFDAEWDKLIEDINVIYNR